MRYFFSILFSLILVTTLAQGNDFLLLKKKNNTVKHFLPGQNIQFVTSSGTSRDALITGIRNDSIFLQEFLVYRVPTTYGGYVLDTAGSFRYSYNYKEIYSMGKKRKGFNIGNSGSAIFGGGVVLTVASGVVWLADREKFSPGLMGASAGLAAIGYFVAKRASKPIVVGKKGYRLEYITVR